MINNMKKLLFLFSVIALAACGDSDDGVNTPPDVPSPRLLTVEVGENPMQDESANAREMTRAGDATTTATLSGFTMNYTDSWYNDFKKTGDTWSTANWPTTVYTTPIDFYAYNGGTFYWYSGNPYVSFTAEENVASMKDLLVATHKSISFNDNNGHVSLTFDHACAAVEFFVYNVDGASYNVSSIVLKNVCKQGEYYYNNTGATPKWQNVQTTTNYTLTTTSIDKLSTTPQRLPCGWLYLIPQSKSGIKIDVTYSKGSGTTSNTKTLSLPAGTWEAGMQYTVNIRIGGPAS